MRYQHGNPREVKTESRGSLHRLLTNVAYAGQVRNQNQLYFGEQSAIVPPEIWRRVQDLLQSNHSRVRGRADNRSGALLQGLLYCTSCRRAMTPTSCRHNGKGYRYYLCCGADRRGRQSCPAQSIPAETIEEAVLEQIQHQAPDVDVRCQTPGAQLRLVRLWIGRVDYDGARNKVTISFAPNVFLAQPPSRTQETI